ncbi:MAG TPA: hypothetical protein DCM14_04655 [Clostridiales bacterium UBA8153]|nr:hypothetical protein [Clostridiales bacterium UBA8153]
MTRSRAPGGSGEGHDRGELEPYGGAAAGRAARLAVSELARRLQVNRRELVLQKVIPMSWPDASLGCAEPDRAYAQVLTPGYVVVLSYGQDEYEYRTDGKSTLVCIGPRSVPS